MVEGTFEFECMRAELLGLDKPDKDVFELLQAERLKTEKENLLADTTDDLDQQDESLVRNGGKLDELNTILTSTQQKLNNFKKTACTSLSNIFKRPSIDEPSTSKFIKENQQQPEQQQQQQQQPESSNINDALDNLDEMKKQSLISNVEVAKNASIDIKTKMTSHLDKLDSLINKADNAEMAMSAQTKQMKKMAK